MRKVLFLVTVNNGSLGIALQCNCKNNGPYTIGTSVRERVCGFALSTWRIRQVRLEYIYGIANERASSYSYMQRVCASVSIDTYVRMREEVQSGSTKVVAFHKGHIHHNSPRLSGRGVLRSTPNNCI